MKKFLTNKLIRDKSPEILAAKGITYNGSTISGAALVTALKQKLLEEAQEAINEDNIVQELADVLEVIHSLASALNFTLNDIETARIKKYNERGGFQNGVFCEYITMEDDNPAIAYYTAKPNKYPAAE